MKNIVYLLMHYEAISCLSDRVAPFALIFNLSTEFLMKNARKLFIKKTAHMQLLHT